MKNETVTVRWLVSTPKWWTIDVRWRRSEAAWKTSLTTNEQPLPRLGGSSTRSKGPALASIDDALLLEEAFMFRKRCIRARKECLSELNVVLLFKDVGGMQGHILATGEKVEM